MTSEKTLKNPPVVLFDGVCNFCHASVQFVIQRNARADILFCQIQSAAGQRLMTEYGLSGLGLDSMVLIQQGRAYVKSDAALRIARLMDRPWPLLVIFILIPAFLRHPVYDWIGRQRYRWYGRRDACWTPGADIQHRFLS